MTIILIRERFARRKANIFWSTHWRGRVLVLYEFDNKVRRIYTDGWEGVGYGAAD